MSDTTSLDSLDVIGPDTYAKNGYPHAAWKRLRNESASHWFTPRVIRRRRSEGVQLTRELLAKIAPDGETHEAAFVADLARPFERMRSSFLGGMKRMPIRFRIRPENG